MTAFFLLCTVILNFIITEIESMAPYYLEVENSTFLSEILNPAAPTSDTTPLHINITASLEYEVPIVVSRPGVAWVVIECASRSSIRWTCGEGIGVCLNVMGTTQNVTVTGCTIYGTIQVTDDFPSTSKMVFTLQNGIMDGSNQTRLLTVQGIHTLVVRNVVLRYGRDRSGGCVNVYDVRGTFLMEGTTLHGCTGSERGGCLFFTGNRSFNEEIDFLPRTTNITFKDSVAQYCQSTLNRGGAVYLVAAYRITFENAYFSNNTAFYSGGSVFIFDVTDTVTAKNITILSSSSRAINNEGGCFSCTNMNTIVIQNSKFRLCSASRDGGALRLHTAGHILVNDVEIESSTSDTGRGAGLYAATAQTVVLKDVRVRRCSTGNAGCIHVEADEYAELTNVVSTECVSNGCLCISTHSPVTVFNNVEAANCSGGLRGCALRVESVNRSEMTNMRISNASCGGVYIDTPQLKASALDLSNCNHVALQLSSSRTVTNAQFTNVSVDSRNGCFLMENVTGQNEFRDIKLSDCGRSYHANSLTLTVFRNGTYPNNTIDDSVFATNPPVVPMATAKSRALINGTLPHQLPMSKGLKTAAQVAEGLSILNPEVGISIQSAFLIANMKCRQATGDPDELTAAITSIAVFVRENIRAPDTPFYEILWSTGGLVMVYLIHTLIYHAYSWYRQSSRSREELMVSTKFPKVSIRYHILQIIPTCSAFVLLVSQPEENDANPGKIMLAILCVIAVLGGLLVFHWLSMYRMSSSFPEYVETRLSSPPHSNNNNPCSLLNYIVPRGEWVPKIAMMVGAPIFSRARPVPPFETQSPHILFWVLVLQGILTTCVSGVRMSPKECDILTVIDCTLWFVIGVYHVVWNPTTSFFHFPHAWPANDTLGRDRCFDSLYRRKQH
eukprot:PhF_6_TR35430/c0_g1_i2/m.51625